jgi:hypothetical protein
MAIDGATVMSTESITIPTSLRRTGKANHGCGQRACDNAYQSDLLH